MSLGQCRGLMALTPFPVFPPKATFLPVPNHCCCGPPTHSPPSDHPCTGVEDSQAEASGVAMRSALPGAMDFIGESRYDG